jgi:hypothetical protein
MPSNQQWDWIETLSKIAGSVGLNQVRVRWKLMGWRDSWRNRKHQARVTAEHIGYEHRICPSCGSIQDRALKICGNCGQPLTPRPLEMLNRLGLVAPRLASVSSILTAAILICYARTVVAGGGLDILYMDGNVLYHFGANDPPAVVAGQWRRLST